MSTIEYTLLEVSCSHEFYASLRLAQPFENPDPGTSVLMVLQQQVALLKDAFYLTAHKYDL